eukprot:scaffold527_cov368-Prasinococcus_capsulatus_cf.AAC.20
MSTRRNFSSCSFPLLFLLVHDLPKPRACQSRAVSASEEQQKRQQVNDPHTLSIPRIYGVGRTGGGRPGFARARTEGG